jgi:hypothetical protein
MRYLIFVLCIAAVSSLKAQHKLYLHDMYNGNYIVFRKGSEIQIVTQGDSLPLNDIIKKITPEGFLLSKHKEIIAVSDVLVVLNSQRQRSARSLKYLIGVEMIGIGGLSALIGPIVAIDSRNLGFSMVITGFAFGLGGAHLMNEVSRKHKEQRGIVIDNVNHRLFIE